jgi:hypothetical protein
MIFFGFEVMFTFDHLEHGRIFLEHQMRSVPAVIKNHVRLPVLRVDALVNAPPEIFLALSSPGENCETYAESIDLQLHTFFKMLQGLKKQAWTKDMIKRRGTMDMKMRKKTPAS